MDTGQDPVATPQRGRGLSRCGTAPPDEWEEPGRLLRRYKPGPNDCSNLALHRASPLNVGLYDANPAQRQYRRLATLDLVVESLRGRQHHPCFFHPDARLAATRERMIICAEGSDGSGSAAGLTLGGRLLTQCALPSPGRQPTQEKAP
jgi:hypothetical protein